MPMQKIRKRQFTFSSGYALIALIVLWGLQALVQHADMPRAVPYSEFLSLLDAGRVKEVSLGEDQIVASLKPTDTTSRRKKGAPKAKDERIRRRVVCPRSTRRRCWTTCKRGVAFSGHIEKDLGLSALLISAGCCRS